MLPDRVSNPGPLTYESGALSIALRGLTIISNTGLRNLIHTNTNSLTAGLRTSEKQCSAYGRSGNIFTGSSRFSPP